MALLNLQSYSLGEKKEVNLYLLRYRIYLISYKIPLFVRCFEKAIIARLYLRSNNVKSVIYFGIKKENDELKAHAWLIVDDFIVTGGEGHEEFKVLKTFY